jgi:hypothetical protein
MVKRTVLFCIIMLCFFSVEARAQNEVLPRHEVYVGMDWLVQSDRLLFANDVGVGVDGSYTYFLNPHFGLMVNGASYTSVNNPIALIPGARFDSQFFMGGPRVVHRWERITVHGHVLLGMNHESLDPGILSPLLPKISNSGFAWSTGGGVDYNITKNWGWRLFQLDVGRNQAPAGSLLGDPLVTRTTILTGIIYKWGDVKK